MSQISPPIRIVLIAAVGLIAAWMLFLRPKAEEAPAPTPASATAPGVNGLTSAVDKAKGAVATQEASDAKVQQATGETAAATGTAAKSATKTTPATAAKAIDPALAGIPAPVAKAISKHKVVVLLFWNPRSVDDRQVKAALKHVDRWNGLVYTQSTPIDKVSKFDRITRGVDVEQSPTVVVIDRKKQATPLVGYFDTETIDQAVVDAIRNSGPTFKAEYLAKINNVCLDAGSAILQVPAANYAGAENKHFIRGYENAVARFTREFKAVPAGPKFRSFRKASVRDLNEYSAAIVSMAALVGNGSVANVQKAITAEGPRLTKAGNKFNARMDKKHVMACGTNG